MQRSVFGPGPAAFGDEEPGLEVLAEERVDGPFLGFVGVGGTKEQKLLDCRRRSDSCVEVSRYALGLEDMVDGGELDEDCFQKLRGGEYAVACRSHFQSWLSVVFSCER